MESAPSTAVLGKPECTGFCLWSVDKRAQPNNYSKKLFQLQFVHSCEERDTCSATRNTLNCQPVEVFWKADQLIDRTEEKLHMTQTNLKKNK